MIAQIGGLLIDTAGGLLVLALLLRFYFLWLLDGRPLPVMAALIQMRLPRV